MTYEQFQSQVNTMITNLSALAANPASPLGLEKADYPIAVCEAAAEISGQCSTFAKMFNRSFRENAVSMMFDRALEAVR